MKEGVIGIDIGGTDIKSAAVVEGEIRYEDICPTPPQNGLEGALTACTERLLAAAEADGVQIRAIGMGSPGIVSDEGIILFSNNLPLKNFDLVTPLRERFSLPVTVLNDALCAALAEHRLGAGRGARDMAMITIGTGLGCVFVLDNKLYTGRNGTAVCGGHTVIDRSGAPCNCGHRGCWERYASTSGLIAEAEKERASEPGSMLWQKQRIDGKLVFAAEQAGDAAAVRAVNTFFSSLADGVIGIVNLLRPERIVVGGGVSAQGKTFADRLAALVKDKTYAAFETAPYEIVTARFKNTAGILGAALYAEEKIGG